VKFAIYSVISQLEGLPLAIKLQEEGYDCVVFLMEEKLADPEAKPDRSKHAEMTRPLYAYVGNGLVTKSKAPRKPVGNTLKDRLIVFDFNYGVCYANVLRDLGYEGLMPEEWAYRLERQRNLATEFVRERYRTLCLPEEQSCPPNSADKIRAYLDKSKDVWCIKPDSEDLTVFVPNTRAETWRMEQDRYLKENAKDLNKVSIQLQRRVQGYEVDVETWYRNGYPILANVDLENKNMFAGDLPPQTGCAGDLVFTIPIDSQLRRICNAPFDKFAQAAKFTGVMDANVIFEKETHRPYFLEFCSGRFGYNALFTFLDKLQGNIGKFLTLAITGEPAVVIPPSVGASVRIFDTSHYENLLRQPTKFRTMTTKDLKPVWLWDCFKIGDTIKIAGANANTCVVTASANTAGDALKEVKQRALGVSFEGSYFRYDIDSRDGNWSILNRSDYLRTRGFL